MFDSHDTHLTIELAGVKIRWVLHNPAPFIGTPDCAPTLAKRNQCSFCSPSRRIAKCHSRLTEQRPQLHALTSKPCSRSSVSLLCLSLGTSAKHRVIEGLASSRRPILEVLIKPQAVRVSSSSHPNACAACARQCVSVLVQQDRGLVSSCTTHPQVSKPLPPRKRLTGKLEQAGGSGPTRFDESPVPLIRYTARFPLPKKALSRSTKEFYRGTTCIPGRGSVAAKNMP